MGWPRPGGLLWPPYARALWSFYRLHAECHVWRARNGQFIGLWCPEHQKGLVIPKTFGRGKHGGRGIEPR